MSQKLTLTRYLEGRGSVKSLTRIEAEAFGVPYPLVSGWPARYGATEITTAMLDDLTARVAVAGRSTAKKARRGLEGVGTALAVIASPANLPQFSVAATAHRSVYAKSVLGFTLRRARRFMARDSAERM